MPEWLHGLFNPSFGSVGLSARARWPYRVPSTFRGWRPNLIVRCLPTSGRPPNYDWTGFYVGAYIDGTWSKASAATVDNVSGANSGSNADSSRWGGGVQLGFDYMLPSRIVLGVAADISSGGTRTTTVSDASGISANPTQVFDSETIRGRIGYAADNICSMERAASLGPMTSLSAPS